MPSKRAAALVAVLTLLLLFGLVALLPKEQSPTGDLAVSFLGITNNPTRSYAPVRLEMVQGAGGLCAVFRVSNVTSNHVLNYEGEERG